MCGIIGFTGNDEALAASMMDAIKHRGPDDVGIDCDDAFSFGNRRLAVIDLSAKGHQPMWTEDKKFGIAFVGEIYNYKDLKKKLEAKGIHFVSESDTEVILKGYVSEGKAFVEKMRGMWTFAIYDREKREVIIVRDPFGIKPLYILQNGKDVAFASEMKALNVYAKKRGVKFHFSPVGCASYFTLGYAIHPYTVFEEIKKVEPGTIGTLSLDTGALSFEPYAWPEPTLPDTLEEALKDSVSNHLVADVPLGVFLSGGVDSTLIALMLRDLKIPLHAFTVHMEGRRDAEYASAIAKFSGLTHHVIPLTRERLAEAYEEFFTVVDEPVADTAIIPSLVISREARKVVTCVLTGEGGDELFFGYDRYKVLSPISSIQQEGHSWQSTSNPLELGLWKKITRRIRLMGARAKNDLLGAYIEMAGIGGDAGNTGMLQKVLRERHGGRDADMSFFDEEYYLPDALLYKNDIATMAHSIEGRTPFLDVMVEAYARKFSKEQKFSGGVGKKPLRALLRAKLPPELLMKEKSGFSVPRELLEPHLRHDFPAAAAAILKMKVPGISLTFLEKLKEPAFVNRVFKALPALPFATVVFSRVVSEYDVAHAP